MVYKYTSINRVLSKFFTDMDIQEEAHRINDYIEWAAEAVEKIGAQPALETRVTGKGDKPITVLSNYYAQLPSDLFRINQVAYAKNPSGPWKSMHMSTGNMDIWGTTPYDKETIIDTTTEHLPSKIELINVTMNLFDCSYDEALLKLNESPEVRSQVSFMISDRSEFYGEKTGVYSTEYIYVVKPGYINTNVRDGYLMISYQAVPTDENGLPLIPDDQGYIEAVYWYLVKKYMYPKWIKGEIRPDVYAHAESKWRFYCQQAYANAMMPNQDGMESIKNTWLRLVPEIKAHNEFYSTVGDAQHIYNKNTVLNRNYGWI